MGIRSESQFFWKQLGKLLLFIITLPWNIVESLFRPKKIPQKIGAVASWFMEFKVWFFESKVTAWLVLINVVVFFVSVIFFSEELWYKLMLVPESLLAGNVLSLFTSAFLHGNIWHLLGNMTVLIIMGRVIEKELGRKSMLIIYFSSMVISGLASSLLYYFVYGINIPSLGASGAIAGVTAAAILVSPFYVTYLIFGIPVPIFAVGWLYMMSDVLAILNPVPGDNVGHLAHLGGYATIMVLVFFLSHQSKRKMALGFLLNVLIVILTFILYSLGIVTVPLL